MRQERVVDLVADGDGDGGEIEAARRKLRDLEDERRRLRGELDAGRAAVSSEDAVYNEAKRKNIKGRSKMTKKQLERAVGR